MALTFKKIRDLAAAGTLTAGHLMPVDQGADARAVTLALIAAYVLSGFAQATTVRIASTANRALSGLAAIDGVTPVGGDLVLLKNQTTPAENGVWVAAAGAWARSTAMDTWAEVVGAQVTVSEGSTNADTTWLCTSDFGGTLGTTAITFIQMFGATLYQPLKAILTAIGLLATGGFIIRTGVGTVRIGIITADETSVHVANGNGVGSDPVISVIFDTDVTLAANSDTKVASQKAIKTYVNQIVAAQDAMVFKGVIDCSANPNYPAADRGWTYRVSVAGKIGGASGTNVEAGDVLICLTDGTASGNQATVGSAWTIVQANLDGAVIGPASATDSHFAQFDGTTGKLIKGGLALDTDATMAANSDTRLPSQKAVKTLAALKANLAGPSFTGLVTLGGGQLAFPATQSASADPNTLDDYEEGTWTPVFGATTTNPTGVAYSAQSGTYIKIGALVIATCTVTLTSAGTGGVGNIQIQGLPFTVGAAAPGNVRVGLVTLDSGKTQFVGSASVGTAAINIQQAGNNIASNGIPIANAGATANITVTVAYTV